VTPSPQEVSRLLHSWRGGDRKALDELVPLVQRELHRLAQRYLAREHRPQTLQTTALVNEVYLRLIGDHQIDWQDRTHFFAICANLMRRILVDFARSRGYQKRAGDNHKVPLDEARCLTPKPDPSLVALDDALQTLAEFDERKAKVVELRFFGGLDLDETAEVLQVSRDTVKRDWRLAKIWLLDEMTGDNRHAP
jgi:RNA polymerase sigma-70 factor, ECF subfamily